jgi:hypothetical protein
MGSVAWCRAPAHWRQDLLQKSWVTTELRDKNSYGLVSVRDRAEDEDEVGQSFTESRDVFEQLFASHFVMRYHGFKSNFYQVPHLQPLIASRLWARVYHFRERIFTQVPACYSSFGDGNNQV